MSPPGRPRACPMTGARSAKVLQCASVGTWGAHWRSPRWRCPQCLRHADRHRRAAPGEGRQGRGGRREAGRPDRSCSSEPYAAAKLTTAGPQAYKSNPEEVQALFGAALAAQPSRPVQFVLYFVEGKDELTEESKLAVDVRCSPRSRSARCPTCVVVGHTDAVGTNQVNDPLSQQRAEVIRAGLIRNGIAPENITAVGRGKRELLVPTADGVAEPRNRRVEIIVR